MADTIKKITVQVQTIIGDSIAKIDKFTKTIQDANKVKIDSKNANAINDVGNAAEKSARKIAALEAATKKLKGIVAGAVSVTAIIGIGQAAVAASGQMELLRKGLEYSLGKADTSRLIKGIQEIGEASAYDTNQLIPMSRAWINMGENADQAMGRIQKLVDLGSAFGLTTDQIEHANLALSQMAAAGKINAQDMMQLTNAGIPSWSMLAEAIGKSVTETRELAAQGKLTGDAINALWDKFEEKTKGAATTLASSLMGQTSNIEEAVTNSMAVVGDIIREAFDIKGILTEIGEFVEGVKGHLVNIKAAAENIGMKQAILDELSSINPVVGAVASAFVTAFTTIKNVISENIGLIKALIEVIVLVKIAVPVVTALASAWIAVRKAMVAAMIVTQLSTAMEAATMAVGALKTGVIGLTAAMNLNPVVLAITAVSIALVALYNHWDEVKNAAESAMNKVKTIVADVCEAAANFLEGRLIKGVKNVGGAFVEFADMVLPDWAKSSLSVISDMVDKACALLKGLADYARSVMNGFRNAVALSESAANKEIDPEERVKNAHGWIDVPEKPKGGVAISPAETKKGGGGGSSKAISEAQKAVEALIKKYSDADKVLKNVIKSEIEIARIGTSMMPESARATEEVNVKLRALKAAHDEVIDGYEKELAIAAQISDEKTRDNVIKGIEKQIEAENRLNEAKMKQVTFESNLKTNQDETSTLLDKIFGTQDEYERKIKEIQDGVVSIFETADYAKASGLQGVYSDEEMDLISKILKMTPDALQEELDLKGQTLDAFIEQNKERIAEGAKALTESQSNAKTWADNTVKYATMVGDAMSDAMMSWITGAKSGKEALADFVSGLLKTAAQLLTRWLSLFAIFSIVGDPSLAARNASAAVFGAYDNKIKLHKEATGGFITGPGTGTSDSIPAMLSNGEYVIRAAAVKRIGVPTLNAINAGRAMHFADGGYVGGKKMEPSARFLGNLTLQVNTLDASDFDSFLNFRGGGERIQNALIEAERRFAFEMGG